MFRFHKSLKAASKCALDFRKYIDIRKQLHMSPEVGFDCFKTQEFLLSKIKLLGINLSNIQFCKPTGFYFNINGENPFLSSKQINIGFRSDMDGLPITDESNLPYSSKKGNGHLCGHDGHMAMMLGFIDIINKNKSKIPKNCNVRILFQPTEEIDIGAPLMIKNGAIDNLDEIYMFHSWADLPIGQVYLNEGKYTSNCIAFRIEVEGIGSHGSTPENAKDPITCLCEIHQGFSRIKSNGIAAKNIAVINVALIRAGNANNVIPSSGFMEGTIRVFSDDLKKLIYQQMQEVCEYIPKAYGCKGKFIITSDLPSIINSKEPTELVKQNIASILGDNCICTDPLVVAEDFSYYSLKIPACCIFMGCYDDMHPYSNHNPRFDFNDDLLPISILNFLKICEKRMNIKLTLP